MYQDSERLTAERSTVGRNRQCSTLTICEKQNTEQGSRRDKQNRMTRAGWRCTLHAFPTTYLSLENPSRYSFPVQAAPSNLVLCDGRGKSRHQSSESPAAPRCQDASGILAKIKPVVTACPKVKGNVAVIGSRWIAADLLYHKP